MKNIDKKKACEKLEKGYKVVLDKTAFFPEGGGQKADTGFIGESKVTDVQESDDVIYHFVDKELNASTEYNCKLDWEQRFLTSRA